MPALPVRQGVAATAQRGEVRPRGSVNLPVKATGGVAIAVVSSRERKWRQPGLATGDPAFISRLQLVRGIQGAQIHFDFVCAASKEGRAAAGTEMPPGIVAGLALDRHRILKEYRGSVKQRPMMLAAIETVAKPDPVWASQRHNPDVAAQATAGKSVNAASPPKSGGHTVKNGQSCPFWPKPSSPPKQAFLGLPTYHES